MKHTLTHEAVIALSQRMTKEKEDIERRLAKGASMLDMAARYKVPITSFKRIAKVCGIELPERTPSERYASKLLFQDMLAVLVRLAKNAGVPYDEVKSYIDEEAVARAEERQ